MVKDEVFGGEEVFGFGGFFNDEFGGVDVEELGGGGLGGDVILMMLDSRLGLDSSI